jgi:hypothetical protein
VWGPEKVMSVLPVCTCLMNCVPLVLCLLSTGRIAVVFMHASGTLSLRAYNAELANRALQLYESTGQVRLWLLPLDLCE